MLVTNRVTTSYVSSFRFARFSFAGCSVVWQGGGARRAYLPALVSGEEVKTIATKSETVIRAHQCLLERVPQKMCYHVAQASRSTHRPDITGKALSLAAALTAVLASARLAFAALSHASAYRAAESNPPSRVGCSRHAPQQTAAPSVVTLRPTETVSHLDLRHYVLFGWLQQASSGR